MNTFFTDHIIIAFSLTLLAGLATGIGSALAFFAKRTNTSFLAISLGFSAGVMLYVSFVEILDTARITLIFSLGEVSGNWLTVFAFFSGFAIAAVIDRLVPQAEGNPHEMRRIEEMREPDIRDDQDKLKRMGILTAITIAIHNFPEGLATFTAALSDPNLGLAIATAIAIHNIPEGIAVSVPIYYATGSKKKAFYYSFLSGLAEPLGAFVGYVLLLPFFSKTIQGLLFAVVAGIMVFISLDELLPAAEKYGKHHLAIYGVVAGMAVMAVSLLLFV